MTDAPADDLAGLYDFLAAAGALKTTLRSGHTASGRRESVADHSWRLALMAAALAPREPGLDVPTVLKLCLIHDLGEVKEGDVPATAQATAPDRKVRERRDFADLLRPAPAALREEWLRLFDDYDGGRTAEARFVKALDKVETLMQHAQGPNPPDFDYAFNLAYGRAATDAVAAVAALRRLADARTRARMDHQEGADDD
jgi:putative hydrolase of HD superfamily